ncbi:hypothetical protein [Gracilimonas tropica]|uniref:hypothetical protein n=1 Tax=Gracilimonas tropica TaxID=454600 RepID=UPI000376F722|nr:hypothetical protein [Gracilimonas tropica]
MNDILYTVSLKPIWKAVLNLSALFIIVVCSDIIIDVLFGVNLLFEPVVKQTSIWPVFILSLALLGAIISLLYSFYYAIEVSETGFRKQSLFGSSEIAFDEIDEIFCDLGIVSFKCGGKAVSLGSLYSNFDEVMELVKANITNYQDIDFTGKDKRTKQYFPQALDNQ